jgi:deoxycytidine triphosphate deaminase
MLRLADRVTLPDIVNAQAAGRQVSAGVEVTQPVAVYFPGFRGTAGVLSRNFQ